MISSPSTVTVPASVAGTDALGALLERGIKPHTALSELTASGVTPAHAEPGGGNVALMELDGDKGKEYWLGFDNFYVITRYNHSKLYAMAVYQLSEAIAAGVATKTR